MHYELDETWMPFSSLMLKHIYNVLLVCSEYDRFMLEEDGRVEEELYKEYTALGLSNPPKITHVSTEAEALAMILCRFVPKRVLRLVFCFCGDKDHAIGSSGSQFRTCGIGGSHHLHVGYFGQRQGGYFADFESIHEIDGF